MSDGLFYFPSVGLSLNVLDAIVKYKLVIIFVWITKEM